MARQNFLVCCGRAVLPLTAAIILVAGISTAGDVASAQNTTGRFSGGAGSPDPGMAGTPQNENAPNGPGTLGGTSAGGLGVPGTAPGSEPSPGGLAGPPAGPLPNTGMLPRARSRTPTSSPDVGGLGAGSSSLGGAAGLGDSSSGLRGSSSGLSGGSGADGGSALGGTPRGNAPPVLGGSQPPSNPTCGTLAGSTSCARP